MAFRTTSSSKPKSSCHIGVQTGCRSSVPNLREPADRKRQVPINGESRGRRHSQQVCRIPEQATKTTRRSESCYYCCCCSCSSNLSSSACSTSEKHIKPTRVRPPACCEPRSRSGIGNQANREHQVNTNPLCRARQELLPQPQKSKKSQPSECPLGCPARKATNRKSPTTTCSVPEQSCVKCQLIARWTRAQSIQKDQRMEPTGRTEEVQDNGEEDDDAISSLTSGSGRHDNDELDLDDNDKWSLSSCYAATRRLVGQPTNKNPLKITGSCEVKEASREEVELNARIRLSTSARPTRKTRPAPKPPGGTGSDSGNGSGPELVRSRGLSSSCNSSSSRLSGPPELSVESVEQNRKSNLLTESEVYSIEHFLKSHKSSIYVCGCMANLYLTSTQLVDNGRCSKPSPDGWQLNKTGVPVLTFDSGLTRNRSRRKLSINLTERGSGFVLWSDIIDHLSNYRAYNPKQDGHQRDSEAQLDACQSFHVMYLSSNHRLMVGLSFDDPTCARLFLEQVELVTSDPTNISLTGPKLAQRLGPLKKLLGGEQSKGNKMRRAQPDRSTTVSQSGLELSGRGSEPMRNQKPRTSTVGQTPTTWSTLKRAIKFGRRCGAQADGQTSLLTGKTAAALPVDWTGAAKLAAAFRPKPLAELAASGKLYRKSKKLPQKCDISAPCLFQHVTRVDQTNLSQLYTRSLVPEVASSESGLIAMVKLDPYEANTRTGSGSDKPPKNQAISSKREAEKSPSASSSCYSSASISPTNSDYYASGPGIAGPVAPPPKPQQQQQQQSSASGHQKPPKPPQRTCSKELSASSFANPDAGKTKIQAIIRDLESQASAELVDAKRKLMADIADQVAARRCSTEALSRL